MTATSPPPMDRDDVRPGPREQSRARYPDQTGLVARDGIRIAWEVYGDGEPTVLLLPTWSIVHSRIWKLQIPDLARSHRVIAFDPRGNGRSDRPTTAEAYSELAFAADALAVLDTVGVERAVLVSLSLGAQRALILASDHPERIAGSIFVAPALPLEATIPGRSSISRFSEVLDTDEGWARYNAHYWRRDFPGFLEFFFAECLPEAHSTKGIEDAVSWGSETDPESLILSEHGPDLADRDEVLARCARVTCPTLVIHGDDDHIRPHAHGQTLAEATHGRFASIAGGGHLPNVRDPVRVNLLIRDFLGRLA